MKIRWLKPVRVTVFLPDGKYIIAEGDEIGYYDHVSITVLTPNTEGQQFKVYSHLPMICEFVKSDSAIQKDDPQDKANEE